MILINNRHLCSHLKNEEKRLNNRRVFFLLLLSMSRGRYNYYDPDYDPKVTMDNELLLLINEGFFSFVILQTDTKRVLVWGENYPHAELENPVDLKHILSAKYRSAKAVVYSNSFVIIPKALYNEADADNHSKFLTTEPTDVVLVNELDADNYVVFKLNNELAQNMLKYVDQQMIFFAGKVFIAATKFIRQMSPNLYAHVEENRLQLLYFVNEGLLFYNTYQFNNPDELMYYVILVATELDINLDETSIILSGDVNISDKKVQRMSNLLPKVYLNQTQLVKLPHGFLPHQILLISGLTLCESLVEN